jgi:hypothetical protein
VFGVARVVCLWVALYGRDRQLLCRYAPYYDLRSLSYEVERDGVLLVTGDFPDGDCTDRNGFFRWPTTSVVLDGLAPGARIAFRSRCISAPGFDLPPWALPWSDKAEVLTLRPPRLTPRAVVYRALSTSVVLRVENPGVSRDGVFG